MREFSLAEFAMKLLEIQVAEVIALQHGLNRAAALVEKTAKAEIGHYQKSIGPFQAWPELADSTKKDRVNKGFTENDPLLRNGKLRDSISHEVRGLEAVVGSDDDVMVYQEIGTFRIRPRPVLGPAAIHNEKHIRRILGHAAVEGLLGGHAIHPNLGYDFDV